MPETGAPRGLTAERAAQLHAVQATLAEWAALRDDIVAVAVVGSVARGTAHMDSDLDAVVLTDAPTRYADAEDWVRDALGHAARIVRSQPWGAVLERRVRLPSGLEVEFDFAPPSWASTDPVDPGTARVVSGGCRPIHDPHGSIDRLVTAVIALA